MQSTTASVFLPTRLHEFKSRISLPGIFFVRLSKKIFFMKAIFLDRDGVINRKAADGEYITNWLEMETLPGALAAAVALDRAGYLIFVVTNQRGVAIGKILEADLNEIHRRMKQEFVDAGARIKEIYCCPHDVQVNCQCRKPKPGMLFQAAREHNLNLADCWII